MGLCKVEGSVCVGKFEVFLLQVQVFGFAEF